MKEIKCEACGSWQKADQTTCSHCGHAFVDQLMVEREERREKEINPFPIIDIPEGESFSNKLWKKPIQWAQLIFISILSTIAAIASSTVH
jgi:uncharacterized membrane protein YvbJ